MKKAILFLFMLMIAVSVKISAQPAGNDKSEPPKYRMDLMPGKSSGRSGEPEFRKHADLRDRSGNKEIELVVHQSLSTIQKTGFVVDSIVVKDTLGQFDKIQIYSYNVNGLLTSLLVKKWEGGQWVNSWHYTFTYDSDGNMTSFVSETWVGSQWVNWWYETYVYDPDGNMTSDICETWVGSQWVNYLRSTFVYDSDENRTSVLYENWDGNQWVNSWHETYAYDSNGNITSELSESWDGNQWVNDRHITYTYNSNGNSTFRLIKDWTGSQWADSWLDTYTYDSNRNMTSDLIQSWDGGQWVNYQRYTYTYDSNGNKTSYLFEMWFGDQCTNAERGTYTYDSNGNMTSYFVEYWESDHWVNWWREIYTYDSNGNIASKYAELWDGGQWVRDVAAISLTDSFGNQLSALGYEINIFYSEIIVNVSELYAMESFDYPAGTTADSLLGTAGDGWAGSWNLFDGQYGVMTVSGSGIDYEDLRGSVPHAGYLLYGANSSAGGYQRYMRHLEQTWPDKKGNEYWLSCIYEAGNNFSDNGWCLVSFYKNVTELEGIGHEWGDEWIGVATYDDPGRSVISVHDGPQWLVARLIMSGDGSAERVFLWVSPDPAGAEPDTALADARGNWFLNHGFNEIVVHFGGDGAGISMGVDEIRLGTSWTKVSSPYAVNLTDRLMVPTKIGLSQNYPNPFNLTTTINYQVAGNSHVQLKIYTVNGQEIATLVDDEKQPGSYETTWDATNFPGGVYFYRLEIGSYTETRKLVFLK